MFTVSWAAKDLDPQAFVRPSGQQQGAPAVHFDVRRAVGGVVHDARKVDFKRSAAAQGRAVAEW